jgi:hypothetical protein
MREFKPRRCRECGEGTVRPVAKAGRKMPFRNLASLPVPATLAIPTCDHCRNEWIDPKTAKALDEALEGAYANELYKRLEAALETILSSADVSQRRLEQLLGLSLGYLSRVRGKRGDASAQLVSTLALIAEDPKRRLKELDHVWQPEA